MRIDDEQKNPDALALGTGWKVDIKVPEGKLSVASIKKGMVRADCQHAGEVILDARKDFSYESAWRGMIQTLRARSIKVRQITFLLPVHEVKTYRAESIRKLRSIKKHDGHRK